MAHTDLPPLTRVVTLAGYVQTLRGIGAPVDAGLRRAGLPTLFEECPSAWVPLARLQSFVADMAAREGLPDLGLLARPTALAQVVVPGIRNTLFRAPTLYHALRQLPAVTRLQTTRVRLWLERHGEQVRFCILLPSPATAPGHHISEVRLLSLMELAVAGFAGPGFIPTRRLLSSRRANLDYDVEAAFGDVPAVTDQACCAIEFPRALLWVSRGRTAASPHRAPHDAGDVGPPGTAAEALEACIEPHLLEGYPPVSVAAEIMGWSVRRLQRSLQLQGTSYRRVIDRVRLRRADRALRHGKASITEIALSLGYSDDTAFTRAFRRWTGFAPSEFRSRAVRAEHAWRSGAA